MTMTCNTCTREFEAKRSDARYCSSKCRVAAHRKARGIVSAPRKRRPLTDTARDVGSDLSRLAGRVARLVADDRFSKNVESIDVYMRWSIDEMRRQLDLLEEALPARVKLMRPDEIAALVSSGLVESIDDLYEPLHESEQ